MPVPDKAAGPVIPPGLSPAAALARQLGAAADATIKIPGLGNVSIRDILADLDADHQMVAALKACAITPGG